MIVRHCSNLPTVASLEDIWDAKKCTVSWQSTIGGQVWGVILWSGHGPVGCVHLDKWGSQFIPFSLQSWCLTHLTELEVFPARNQTSLTIARLLVEHIVPRHGVPSQLLSNRGAAFLFKLMEEVYRLLGYVQLPYVLFAYRATSQQSTQESPFTLCTEEILYCQLKLCLDLHRNASTLKLMWHLFWIIVIRLG